jgi:prenyltransferase beta subunit
MAQIHEVRKFIFNLYNADGTFRFSPGNKIANIYSTCFGVMCLNLINELKNFHQKDIDKISNYLQSYQDKKTGFFKSKKLGSNLSSGHTQEYLNLVLTDYIQTALFTLEVKPKYRYHFLTKYKEENFLKEWLNSLDWNNPWLASCQIMALLNLFIYELEEFDEEKNKIYIDFILSFLDTNQNPKNGYWDLKNKSTYHNQMAGAYHYIYIYTYLNKSPKFVEKIIDSTLRIQNFDGLFNYAGGGGSCDDLDAIDLLCRSTFYTDYKNKKIVKAMKKSYLALLKNQNLDGGFCWAKRSLSIRYFFSIINFSLLFKASLRDFLKNFLSKIRTVIQVLIFPETLSWKHSTLDSMKLKMDQSDLFSTWFRLTCIGMIETTFPECFEKSFNWKFTKRSGLGFYNKIPKD